MPFPKPLLSILERFNDKPFIRWWWQNTLYILNLSYYIKLKKKKKINDFVLSDDDDKTLCTYLNYLTITN